MTRQPGRQFVSCLSILLFSLFPLAAATPAEQAYQRAAQAMQSGEFRSAVSELRLSVRLDPQRPEFQYALALALSRLGDWESAAASIRKCLQLQPAFQGANYLAGEIEGSTGNHQRAVGYLRKAREQTPNDFLVLSALGIQLAALGRFAEAKQQFSAAIQLRPDFPGVHFNLGITLLNLGDPEAAEKAFRRVLEVSPDHAQASAQLAHSLLAQARAGKPATMQEVANAFRKAILRNPSDPELHFNLAYALGRLKDNSGALAEYSEVLRLQPDYPSVHSSLGVTHYLLQEWPQAVEHLRKALDQGQDGFAEHYYYGSALLRTGDHGIAAQHLRRAAQLNSDHSGVHFQLASLYRKAGENQRVAKELEEFSRLRSQEDDRKRAQSLSMAAKIALDRNDLHLIINALEQLYNDFPDPASARNLGLAYIQQGNFEKAREFLKTALDLSPTDAAAYNYLGLLETRIGNLTTAYEYFRTAVVLDHSVTDASYNAGLAALHLGNQEVAIQHLQTALAGADTAQVRQALALALTQVGRHGEAQEHFDAAQGEP